jgi:hypothetical protein
MVGGSFVFVGSWVFSLARLLALNIFLLLNCKMGLLGRVLTFVVAAFFIFNGVNKLTPAVVPELHQQLTTASTSWANVWRAVFPPVIWEQVQTAERLKQAIGITEIVAGVLLFTPLSGLATLALLGVMAGATYTHLQLQEVHVSVSSSQTFIRDASSQTLVS